MLYGDRSAIFIHSHRRSGTHLLIDTIISYFDVLPGYQEFPPVLALKALPDEPGLNQKVIVKTHEPRPFFQLNVRHLWASREANKQARLYYDSSSHLYIARNPFQVLKSLYIFDFLGGEPKFKLDRECTFEHYILDPSKHEGAAPQTTRIEYWLNHMLSWSANQEVLFLSYEDVVDDPVSVMRLVSEHIGISLETRQKKIFPTGIGTDLSRRFLAHGLQISWSAKGMAAVEDALRRLLSERRHLKRLIERWLASGPGVDQLSQMVAGPSAFGNDGSTS